MTEKHHLLTNDEFEEKFSHCDMPAVLFTHEAHLRLSYIHITKYGLDKAIENLSTQIANCDNKYGDGTKFNKSLTIAAVKVMHHFINKAKATNFNALVKEYPQLKEDFLGLLKSHYKIDILTSEKTTEELLELDLLAFN
jgi:hypothetical protein